MIIKYYIIVLFQYQFYFKSKRPKFLTEIKFLCKFYLIFSNFSQFLHMATLIYIIRNIYADRHTNSKYSAQNRCVKDNKLHALVFRFIHPSNYPYVCASYKLFKCLSVHSSIQAFRRQLPVWYKTLTDAFSFFFNHKIQLTMHCMEHNFVVVVVAAAALIDVGPYPLLHSGT